MNNPKEENSAGRICMYCEKCGCMNENGNTYCKKCGSRLPESHKEKDVIKKIKYKKRFRLILGVSALITAVIVFYNVTNKIYDNIIRMEKDCLKNNQYDKAVSYYNNAVSLKKNRYEAYAEMIKYHLNQDEERLDMACTYLMKAPSKVQKNSLKKWVKEIKERAENRCLRSVVINEAAEKNYGIMDITGEQILPSSYTDIQEIYTYDNGIKRFSGYYAIEEFSEWGICDTEGKIIVEPAYSDMKTEMGTELIAVQSEEKWGFINYKGEEIIKPQYDTVWDFSQYGVAVVKQGEKMGIINANGELVLPLKYEYVFDCGGSDDVKSYILCQDDKYGLADCRGNILKQTEYDQMMSTGDDLIRVCLNDEYGYIDTDGNTIISADNAWVGIMGNYGLVPVEYKGARNFLIYNSSGQYTGELDYRTVSSFGDNGLIAVGRDSVWGYADQYGELVIGFQYDEAEPFRNGVAVVTKDEKKGIIDETGKYLLSPEYDTIDNFSNSLFLMTEKDGKYGGYIPGTNSVIPTEYDDTELYSQLMSENSNNLGINVSLQDNGNLKVGRYDLYGELIMPVEYENIKEYKGYLLSDEDGYSKITNLSKENDSGKGLDCQYAEIREGAYPYDLIPVCKDGTSSFMNLEGEKVF